MNRPYCFGVIGGYGATGSAVAQELRRTTDKPIILGGRDPTRLKTAAAQSGATVSAAQLDVHDANSLEDFCGRCAIVVNCAGPVCELQDRVAQAALRAGCHYVDVAGLTLVRESMSPRQKEIADRGLSFVVSAGWLPGMTELLPAYAFARAKASMDKVDALTIFFGDSGEWSPNALRDGAWYLHKMGIKRPRYLRAGDWVPARSSEALLRKDLGPIGRHRFSLVFTPEMTELSRQMIDCSVHAYAFVTGWFAILTGSLIALAPLPQRAAVSLLGKALRARSLPVGGFVVVDAVGRKQERQMSQRYELTFSEGRGYWMNAVVAATVARLIAEGGSVKPGLHFLTESVDPVTFMGQLREAGVNHKGSVLHE